MMGFNRRFISKVALGLSFGAFLVSTYALSVAVVAFIRVFFPSKNSIVFIPDKMTWGNCHVYAWLKYLNEGGRLGIEPSRNMRMIPHSYHSKDGIRTEFVPTFPYRDWKAFFLSYWFRGHIKKTENYLEVENEYV